MKSKKMKIFIILIIVTFCFVACDGEVKYGKEVKNENYRQIDLEDLEEILEKEDYFLIDVREKDEAESGIIPGAKVIPLSDFNSEIKNYNLPKEKIIIIYCASGARSKKVAEQMCEDGYENVYDFGGINNFKGKLTNFY